MEITKDSAKKELGEMVKDRKQAVEKDAVSKLSQEEKQALEEKTKKEQEAKAQEKAKQDAEKKQNEELLAKPDDQLNEEERKKKAELIEAKEKEQESKMTYEEKLQRVKDGAQKRIDEIVNELKQVKDVHSRQAQELKQELGALRIENESLTKRLSQKPEDKEPSVIVQKERERINKYLEEDKALPRERRREMTDDELQEWLIEDVVGAQTWISERTLRRDKERNTDIHTTKKEELIKNFLEKVDESHRKVCIRHPELNIAKREKELVDQGKTKDEIQSILSQENEKYRICAEIVRENPEKYLTKENGPEIVAQEMEKRLSLKNSQVKTADQQEIESLKKRLEEQESEIQALKGDTGLNSNVIKHRQTGDKSTPQTPEEQMLVDTMRSTQATQAMIDSALTKYRANKGKR